MAGHVGEVLQALIAEFEFALVPLQRARMFNEPRLLSSQLLLELNLGGDVLKCPGQTGGAVMFALRLPDRAHPDSRAVCLNERQLQIVGGSVVEALAHGLLNHRPRLGRVELDGAIQRRHVADRQSMNPVGHIRPLELAGCAIQLPAADARDFADASQTPLAVPQGLLALLALGDQLVHTVHPLRLAVGGPGPHPAAVQHPDPGAIAVLHPGLAFVIRSLTGEMSLQRSA